MGTPSETLDADDILSQMQMWRRSVMWRCGEVWWCDVVVWCAARPHQTGDVHLGSPAPLMRPLVIALGVAVSGGAQPPRLDIVLILGTRVSE